MTLYSDYLARLSAASSGTPALSASDSEQQAVLDWVGHWTVSTPNYIDLPHWVGRAQCAMYAAASVHLSQVNTGGASMFDWVMADPTQRTVWANCGDSADFYQRAMLAFGIDCRRITCWAGVSDSHDWVEFYSPMLAGYVAYDPLYAIILLDSYGMPAPFDALMTTLDADGLPPADPAAPWPWVPTRITGGTVVATDPGYQEAMDRDYRTAIVRNYYAWVARRHVRQDPAVGEPREFWMVFDHTSFGGTFTQWFREQYEWPVSHYLCWRVSASLGTIRQSVAGDFNGTGHRDSLYREASTGQLVLKEMEGEAVVADTNLMVVPVSSAVHVGDFDGDGRADIMVVDGSSVTIYLMDGRTVASTLGPWTAPANSRVVSVGDYYHYGRDAVTWLNTSGEMRRWRLDGTTMYQSGVINSTAEQAALSTGGGWSLVN